MIKFFNLTKLQTPVVLKLDSTIHRINLYPTDKYYGIETKCAIQCTVIYPVDSAIQLLNNWGQVVSCVWYIILPASIFQFSINVSHFLFLHLSSLW